MSQELVVKRVERVTETIVEEDGRERLVYDMVEVEFTDGRVITFRPDDPRIRDLKKGDRMELTTEGIRRL